METTTRRTLLTAAAALGIGAFLPRHLRALAPPPTDPWSQSDLIQPAAVADELRKSGSAPVVISVAFPFLYRQRHIPNALFAGPTSKPEGITALKNAVSHLPKDANIVIYCGCCPMVKCPNVRPAYETLKDLGFRNVHVLDLPTNFHTDWTAKGYPVEPPEEHGS